MATMNARQSSYGITFVSDLIDLPGMFTSAESEQVVDLTGTNIAGVDLATCLMLVTTTNSPNPGDKAITLWNVVDLVIDGNGIPVSGTLTAYIEFIGDAENTPVRIISTITDIAVDVTAFALAVTAGNPGPGQTLLRQELAGDDLFQMSRFGDSVASEDGQDAIYGYAGDDTLDGGDGADDLFGGRGADQLYGQNGADRLKGGDGDDTLDGGTGDDILFGGLGADMFYFGTGSGRDRIVDFTDGEDLIDFGSGVQFDDIKITQRGGDVVVRVQDQVVFLKNFDANLLDASDFFVAALE